MFIFLHCLQGTLIPPYTHTNERISKTASVPRGHFANNATQIKQLRDTDSLSRCNNTDLMV